MAVAALILGIVGSLFGLVPLTFWVAGPLGVIGLVLGLVALSRARRAGAPKKMAITGTALSALALVLSIVGAVIFFTAVDQLGEDLENIGAPIGTAAATPSRAANDGANSPTSEPPADSGPASGTFGQPVELTVDDQPAGTYTLEKPVVSARGGEFDPRPKHGAYVSVKMTVEALPGKELDANPLLEFYIRGADGARYDYVLAVREPALDAGTASPGRPMTGWVSFDAPTHGTIVFHNAFQDDPIVEWTY